MFIAATGVQMGQEVQKWESNMANTICLGWPHTADMPQAVAHIMLDEMASRLVMV